MCYNYKKEGYAMEKIIEANTNFRNDEVCFEEKCITIQKAIEKYINEMVSKLYMDESNIYIYKPINDYLFRKIKLAEQKCREKNENAELLDKASDPDLKNKYKKRIESPTGYPINPVKDDELITLIKNNPDKSIDVSYKEFLEEIHYKYMGTEDSMNNEILNQYNKNGYICSLIEDAILECYSNKNMNIESVAKQILNQIIGHKIREIRKSYDQPLKFLAHKIGISVSYLNKIEHANVKGKIDFKVIYDIKNFYSCTYDYLLCISDCYDMTKDDHKSFIKNSYYIANFFSADVYIGNHDLLDKVYLLLKKDDESKIKMLAKCVDMLLEDE